MFAPKNLLLLILIICWAPQLAMADWGDDQYALGADHYRNGRWQQAIEQFQSLIDTEPNHARTPVAHFFVGESQIQLQDYSSCVFHFSKFISQTPQHPLRNRAIFRRAEANYLVGKDVDAIVQLKEVLKDSQSAIYHEFALVYLGEMLQRLPDAKHQQEAKEYFQQALSQFPESTLVGRCRLGLAQIFQAAGEYQEADRFLTFLIESGDPEIADQAVVSRASILVELENYSQAKQLLSDSRIDSLPFVLQAKSHYWRGRSELGLNRWDDAVDHLRKALAGLGEDPLAEAAAYDCAIAYWRKGDLSSADTTLEDSIGRWPKGRWVAECRFLRVQAALETGDTTELQSLVNQFANYHSGHPLWPRVLEAEGRAAFARADYNKASTSFRKLLDIETASTANATEPWRPNWIYMLGVSEIAKGDYVAGLKSIDQCIRTITRQTSANLGGNELYSNALFAKCTALFKLTRYQDALDAQQDWLKTFPDSPLRNDILTDQLQCLIALEKWDECQAQTAWIQPLMKQSDSGTIARRNLIGASCLKIAKHYFDQTQTEQASQWFEFASLSPDSQLKQKADSGLAWTAFRSSDGDQRDAAFETLINRFPDQELSANAALKQAENLVKDGQSEKAMSILRTLTQRDDSWPNKHLALAMLAELTAEKGSNASRRAAAKLLRDAVNHCQKNQIESSPLDGYLYDLAWLRLDLGQNQESISRFRQINLNFPNSRFWADATFRVAQNYFDQNKLQQAKDTLQQILDRRHESISLTDSQTKDGEKPEPMTGSELVTDALVAHVYYLQAMVAVQEKDWAQVKRHCEALCREYPDHSLRWNAEFWQAESQYRAGQYLAAVAAMRSVTERTAGRLEPWVAMAHLRLAQSLGQRGQWDEAMVTAKAAKKRFTDFRQIFELDYLIGRALAQDARFDEARAAYQMVIDSKEGRNTETAAMAQWMIGETYFHQEQYSLAADAYHRTETLYRFPQWQAAALLQAGKCYEHLGQESDAISVYRQLIRDYTGHSLAGQGQQRLDRLIQKRNLTATGNRNRSR